jgi:phenylacetate-CoA ligase
LLVTVLDNFAQPLVRYRVGDVGRKLPASPCPCGRGYERIEITAGRVSDVFTSPAGRRVHGEYFTHLFYGVEGVAEFRVVQETRARIAVEVVAPDGFDESALAPVVSGIRELDAAFEVEVRRLSALPASESGKRRFTTSRVPVEW